MKTSFQKAERAAQRIASKLGNPSWFLGVGVDVDAREGFALSIRVASGSAEHAEGFTPRFDGVRVRIVERQMAKPRKSAAS